MKWYLFLISVSVAFIMLLNIILSLAAGLFSVLYAVLGVLVAAVFVFAIDIIVSALLCLFPRKWFNPDSKIFAVSKRERGIYERLGIRRWKDKIPIGKGPIGVGFRKDKVEEKDNPAYIQKFLVEGCFAEIMHLLSAILGFGIIFLFPIPNTLSISIPIALVNCWLQVMPILVQRYLRPKLLLLRKRAMKNDGS